MASNFPVVCIEDIFRHLNGNDLLTCTLVCPEWNNFIGSTKMCMRKISLSCCQLHRLGRILKNSKRKYACLRLATKNYEDFQNVISEDGRAWTHVKVVINVDFESVNNFVDFLWVFQSTVRDLLLNFGTVQGAYEADVQSVVLPFPNLKTLDVYSTFVAAFVNCTSLESLSISLKLLEIPPSTLTAIRTILKSNKGLKKLKLHGGTVFKEDFSSEISFKLTELHIRIVMNDLEQRNLNLFLKTQAGTLEVLTIGHRQTMGAEDLKTILSMPRLKKLNLGTSGIHLSELAVGNLPQNQSVASLYFTAFQNNDVLVKTLLKALPKVEYLKIQNMSEEIADFISETCKSLKHLVVCNFRLQNVSNEAFFLNLQEFTCQQVGRSSKNLSKRLRVCEKYS